MIAEAWRKASRWIADGILALFIAAVPVDFLQGRPWTALLDFIALQIYFGFWIRMVVWENRGYYGFEDQ